MHFGLALKHSSMNNVKALHRVWHWFLFASILIIVGLIIHVTAFMPMNKQLWSLSYSLFMSGTCGFSLAVVYYIVDLGVEKQEDSMKTKFQRFVSLLFKPLQCMGMNAILVFCWHGPAEQLLEFIYITDTNNPLLDNPNKNTLLSWFQQDVLGSITGDSDLNDGGVSLLYVIVKLTIYFLVTMHLAKIGYFWKV